MVGTAGAVDPAVHRAGWQRAIAAAILTLGALAALWGLLRPAGPGAPGSGLAVGSAAPPFSLPLLEGGQVSLAELKGRPLVLNFWASWCSVCRIEMPDLEAAFKQGQDVGLVVLGVNLGESEVAVRAFRDRLNLTFPVALDKGQEVTRLYEVVPLPTTYFIDAGGVIRALVQGQLRPDILRRNVDLLRQGW